MLAHPPMTYVFRLKLIFYYSYYYYSLQREGGDLLLSPKRGDEVVTLLPLAGKGDGDPLRI